MKLGRHPEDVERAAKELADKRILANEDDIYQYAADRQEHEMVAKFVEALSDREKRLLILTAVLQKR